MFIINEKKKEIHVTRGDIGSVEVLADISDDPEIEKLYVFQPGDVVRFKVFDRKNVDNIQIKKDVIVSEETEVVNIPLTKENTKIGGLINKPVKYWYEIELNPDTNPQSIVCYDEKIEGQDGTGEKLFILYPEGDEE